MEVHTAKGDMVPSPLDSRDNDRVSTENEIWTLNKTENETLNMNANANANDNDDGDDDDGDNVCHHLPWDHIHHHRDDGRDDHHNDLCCVLHECQNVVQRASEEASAILRNEP